MIHARLVIPKHSLSVLAAKSRQNYAFVSKPLLLSPLRQQLAHLQSAWLTVAYFAVISGEKEPIRKTNAVVVGHIPLYASSHHCLSAAASLKLKHFLLPQSPIFPLPPSSAVFLEQEDNTPLKAL